MRDATLVQAGNKLLHGNFKRSKILVDHQPAQYAGFQVFCGYLALPDIFGLLLACRIFFLIAGIIMDAVGIIARHSVVCVIGRQHDGGMGRA